MASERHSAANIDWKAALEAHQHAIATGDSNRFIEIAMPLAEFYAKSKAKHFAGSRLATRLDEDVFISAAMEGLLQVSRTEDKNGKFTPEKLRNLCAQVVKCRLIDVCRTVLPRSEDSNKKFEFSLDGLDGHARQAMLGIKDPQQGTESQAHPARVDNIDFVLSRVREVLPSQQYEAVSALLQNQMSGLEHREIAEQIGKTSVTFNSLVAAARKTLRNKHPEIEQEVRQLLLEPRANLRVS